ncbi:pilus assembly protein PilZ [Pseudomonas sp. MF6784]|jgi:general secretion pathway protein C|uniref:pilus assembly protein PilZ n=1 Tax=Pseudomonas sp. MF5691 TaxID=2797526 RepID=UPI001474747A|nr:pilus assembly protein PilZ [Pseudomonas sp. MF5691]MBJ2252119.1 pilus assembly protein PilZ [Pseudomonas sp. MF6784]MBU4627380.1 pilus assembly protein PilZ [Pseudomonas sp. BF61]NMX32917.1 general secretion pathway protein GspB [Pseudomonas sp. WS 5413]QXH87101.1 general secretion pathway protein GspB [Pseudomonas shahriarae]MBJ2293311.1 pilus assembly protein PilZ [Pseudomonas sp. MF5691]
MASTEPGQLNRAGNLLLATLLAWLAAQCVLQLWHGIAQPIALNPPAAPVADLLSNHWTPRQAPSDDLPLTTLKVDYLGSLKATPLRATVLVLRYQQQERTLTLGQRLAPGIVLQDIDDQGLIFDNQGQRERLPWPTERPVIGLKRKE